MNSRPVNSACVNLELHSSIPCKVTHLDTGRSRGLLVLPQVDQQLTEALLSRAAGTACGALARNIDQLGNALPASATSRGIFPVRKELLSFGASLRAVLVCLVVV
jgi:hypothetical protein